MSCDSRRFVPSSSFPLHSALSSVARALLSVLLLLAGAIAVPAAEAGRAQAPPPAGASPDWLSHVEKQIRDAEYEITWQSRTRLHDLSAAWHAPNRAHGFRTYFTDQGIRLVGRTGAKPSWEWGLALVGYDRGAKVWPVDEATLSTDKNRIEYNRGDIVEWYVNDRKGLKQGFTLAAPPEETGLGPGEGHAAAPAARRSPFGERLAGHPASSASCLDSGDGHLAEDRVPVYLVLALTGTVSPVVSPDGQSIDFTAPGGARVVRYAELRVTDAAGSELAARMEAFSDAGLRGIRLAFDDEGATYPVTVDPLVTSPAWTAESDQAGASFGGSVATAGDVNGDGFADVIVGAESFDNGQASEGRAFVYYGSASGLSATAAWTAESDQVGARLGLFVATAGDVNGDGYADVIIGACYYDNGEMDEGRAFVYHGSATGLSGGPNADPNDANWTAESDQVEAYFGASVATAGDVNGDGFADVIIGAPYFTNGETYEGRAFVYHGSASGLPGGPHADPNDADWSAEGDQAFAILGYSVATAGDVNGDGFTDVIVGATGYDNGESGEGHAFVYHGSASGLSGGPNAGPNDADWSAEGDQGGAEFGWAVATAGDVNGDGYADVIVGAQWFHNGQSAEGRAFVYHGSASGLSSSANWTAESDQEDARHGTSVATAGDVNGDGFADVIVGAVLFDNRETDEGQAFVYHGSASGLSASADWTAESNQAGAHLGWAAGTAGDVNGDGYDDVILAAPSFDNGQTNEGRAYVYHGSTGGLATSAGWTAESDQARAEFGISVATAGDVNGDGFADAIVGARHFDNGQADEGRAFAYHGSASGLATTPAWTAEANRAEANFGISVATAGDVNGDGYADVIVGAHRFDNYAMNEGGAFVYHGSASGLATTPAWTAESDQPNAAFGWSVATAGDVNGDGYADVIVGARSYDNGQTGEGSAFVYHGSASGLATTPAWTAESDQGNAHFGWSVATAGDVNGDGFADAIVGARDFDNGQADEGRAFVYHGSASGLATTPAWAAEGDQDGAWFGLSVATAGDVNGDGFADVIVGAPKFYNSLSYEGRAFVYHGSTSGLAPTPAWTAEGNQTDAWFGLSVATAGDVNGDGYADVIVGAWYFTNPQFREGRASVYHGSASGLSASAGWTAESDQADAQFGSSVATAGDVNGDGYADVIVGAWYFDNGETDEGRAFLYYGNEGPGLTLRPQQRRADDSAPVAHLGMSESLDSFRLAFLGRTPFGRSRVKLEWEIKPFGTPLDGTGTQVSASWMDTGTAGAALNELVTGLSGSTLYHWRARLLYDPARTPFQHASRWLTVPSNGWQEADLRTYTAPVAGRIPDGRSVPGTPLGITLEPSGDVTLSWDASCIPTDTDYEIYEGTLGSFTTHTAVFCTTGGATTKTFTPAGGSVYYLVVPRNAIREGSYGLDSAGVQRPQGVSACLPQAIGACP